MAVEVRIPSLLKSLVNGASAVKAEGRTVAEVVDDLEQRYPGMKAKIVDGSGQIKQFVNVFLNSEDVRFLGNLQAPVRDGDRLSILPAIVGGHDL